MEKSRDEGEPPFTKKPKLADKDDVIIVGASTSAEGRSDNPPLLPPSAAAVQEGACPPPLFYLTKVRGASRRFNDSKIAIDIKGN